MKNKKYFILLLIVTGFFACKKDAELTLADDHTIHHAYFTGLVVDSVTGNPVVTSISNSYTSDSTDANGRYVCMYTWKGIRGRSGYTRLPDNFPIAVVASTDNVYGFIIHTAGQFIENDTITLPVIYVNPVGHLTVHIKDTSGVFASDGDLECAYLVGYANSFDFRHPDGDPIDTTLAFKTYPNRSVALDWSYSDGTSAYNHVFTQTVFVPAGDSTFINIFY